MDIFIKEDSLISLYFLGDVCRFIDDFSNSPFVFSEKNTEDKDRHNLRYSMISFWLWHSSSLITLSVASLFKEIVSGTIISVSVLSPLTAVINSNNPIYILPNLRKHML